MFIPLMVVAVVAVIVSMDPAVSVIVVAGAGFENGSPESHGNNHGRHQEKRTEISVYSHVFFFPDHGHLRCAE